MIGVRATRNNLKVKNVRQPVKRKDVKMFMSGTQYTQKGRYDML